MDAHTRGTNTILPLDENGLYILLSDQDRKYHWHWSLYLHREMLSGSTFHIARPSAAVPWRYEDVEVRNIIFSLSVTLALKIAIIPPDMDGPLRDRLARVPMGVADTKRWGPLTCRTWLLRALSELDDEGYISIKPSATVEEVEAEAFELARDNATAEEGGKRLRAEDRVHHSTFSVP
ncbi:hypothetical protein ISF_07156 [Cordyceps fumosorosea ARSEF 2679]|uniref:Uncharacterized protein n=1 Tax=Cordyceps fumosorosea (strain ARSEF 2679) TaxID=1081104 RepID=A0A167Q2Z6_CORFA|nr:hypothetical protein ISF_07156 [Cordyceps fumosorosea ARSEF 2679]OAA57235.1 hypothetical protein ISF_07156 [Cordyceps fumosorosea ARSEF 2679]